MSDCWVVVICVSIILRDMYVCFHKSVENYTKMRSYISGAFIVIFKKPTGSSETTVSD